MPSFIIEFQPIGIRLVCQEPITVIDAARQANIPLRADCGGKSICGKCIIQVPADFSRKPTKAEIHHLSEDQLHQHMRLACETVAENDIKVFIPANSLITEQVLQTEGHLGHYDIDPDIKYISVDLPSPSLRDTRSDFQRLSDSLKDRFPSGIQINDLSLYQQLPKYIREKHWQLSALFNGNELIHLLDTAPKTILGLALDVGSTKIAGYLLDLQSGDLLAAKGIANPQITFGDDIMTRIDAAVNNLESARLLHINTINAINTIVDQLCETTGYRSDSIYSYCLVGNTAMHHLLLDLPVQSLAVSPFVAAMNEPADVKIQTLNFRGFQKAKAFFPPPIAGFVGSDHLAFLLSADFHAKAQTHLGIDIGTNTEIALQKGTRIMSCSTASGPAFEGAHIQHGMRAAPGAIEHVRINGDKILLNVIGDIEAVGICGSGILDVIAEFRRTKIINERGRLDKSHRRVYQDGTNKPYFVLQRGEGKRKEITISQNDIDQILLAKGAIRAGIEILMEIMQVKANDIEEVVIAGAFGSYLDPEHTVRIGMIPEIAIEKIHAVGNAAGAGARMMLLSSSAREKAIELAQRIEYVELTTYPDFALFFANGIRF